MRKSTRTSSKRKVSEAIASSAAVGCGNDRNGQDKRGNCACNALSTTDASCTCNCGTKCNCVAELAVTASISAAPAGAPESAASFVSKLYKILDSRNLSDIISWDSV